MFEKNKDINPCDYLRVVLKNDGDVHVDDDKERYDEIGQEIGDAYSGRAAVARVATLVVGQVAFLLVYYAV